MENTVTAEIDSFLSFKLGDEIFAVNVSKVLEILEIKQITKVPKSPPYMRGVINLRGSVLPVVDTRIKFGLPATEDTIDTCIVVLDIVMEKESITIGALVDGVSEVLDIREEETEPAPSIGIKYKSDFINGMWKNDEAFIMLLNIDKVFSADDIVLVQETKQKASKTEANSRNDTKEVKKTAPKKKTTAKK